ncbi:MAG: hypothetical protein IBJ18_07440 [Phycisphaerales bacterium]|nr:hypothetical protein [Phycisphaerales bacterium]
MNRSILSISAARLLCAAFASLVSCSTILHAGPLSPPLGPVASTSKPLSEIEPRIAVSADNTPGDAGSSFIISQPGSYYLVGNITGVISKNGISIITSNVTLDLNGFTLTGVPNSFRGINVANNINNIVIKNGNVTAWGTGGIATNGGGFSGAIEGIHADANTGNGITVNNAMVVRNCSATNNTGTGIDCYSASAIVDCTAAKNGVHGISVTAGATITNCSATQNTSSGFNSTFNVNSFFNCAANQNTGNGFSVGSYNSFINCRAGENGLDGIRAASRNFIFANTCTNNGTAVAGGAGIHTTGTNNRIETNLCTGADRGIDVDAAASIILRNTCASNTLNWDIAANNVVGPILDRTTPASAAISGNSAPSSTGSSDPKANFTF